MSPPPELTDKTPPPVFWRGFLFALMLPLAASLASPLPFAFLIPLTALIFLPLYVFFCRCLPRPDWPLLGWMAAIGTLGCLSSLWSVTPEASLERALKISLLLLLSVPVIDLARACPPDSLRRLWRGFPLLTLMIGIVCVIELTLNHPLYRALAEIPLDRKVNPSILNKNVAVFTLMLPLSLSFCLRSGTHTLSALLLTIAALLFSQTGSQASQLAILMMGASLVALAILPGAGIPLAFSTTALAITLMPFLAPIAFDTFAQQIAGNKYLATEASASARLENWDFISRKIMDNPWSGFGMDATRSIEDFESQRLFFKSNRIMHPHNLALQIWIEFGVGGVVLALGFLGFLCRRLLALATPARRLPFLLFAGILTFLMISWSVWSGWLIAFMIYLGALLPLAVKTTSVRATA